MRTRLSYIAPFLVAGAVAAAIAAAPTAAAASCNYLGGDFQDTQCQSPGNVQINDSPPPVQPSGIGSVYGPFFTYDRGRR